ncbi:MAG: MlaD family protein [Gemmatimonadota bacterium]|nr:MlaD family protein [Gemmatimonadota bacterium]
MRRATPLTWEQLRVGVFILVALALATGAVLIVGQTGNVFGDRYRLVTLVRTAAGLVPGASVQLAGQPVGQVADIRLIRPEDRPPSGEAVEVWIEVDTRIRDQVRADSRAQIRTLGLLGDKVIDIRPGSAEARVLGPGDTVPAGNSVDYDALIAEGAEAVGELLTVTQNLSELTTGLVEGRGSIGRLVTDEALYESVSSLAANLDSVLRIVAAPDAPLMRILTDDSLYFSLRAATESLEELTASVSRGEGSLGQLLRSDSLFTSLRSSLVRTDSVLARLEAGEGSAGRLLADESLYEELLKMVVDLNALLAAIREDPERYVPPVSVF